MPDSSQRFLFEATDIRGDIVQIDQSLKEILKLHQYPPQIERLLGEFFVASALLASTIKFKGRLVLQVRSEGLVPLLMVEVSDDLKLRGIARLAESASELLGKAEAKGIPLVFSELFAGGSLAVTVDPVNGERYQSLVPLVGDRLADCLMHYFDQSEQLKTYLYLTSDGEAAAGILLQQLPKQLVTAEQDRENQWQHVKILGETLRPEEIIQLSAIDVIQRLYGQENVRVMGSEMIAFQCSCSRARTANALLALGEAEVASLFEEQDVIQMHCEFCNSHYDFDRNSLTETLRGNRPKH